MDELKKDGEEFSSPITESNEPEVPELSDETEAPDASGIEAVTEPAEASDETDGAVTEQVEPAAEPIGETEDPLPLVSDEPAPRKKKSKKGLAAVLIALVVIIGALAALVFGVFGTSNIVYDKVVRATPLYDLVPENRSDATGTVQNMGYAAFLRDDLYFLQFPDYPLLRMNLKSDESTVAVEGGDASQVLRVTRYKNDLYYITVSQDADTYSFCLLRYVDGVNDVPIYVSNTNIDSPQFSGRYFYFLQLSEDYSAQSLYRVPLTGGEAELLLDAYCTAYYVKGNDLYASVLSADGTTGSLVHLNIPAAAAFVREQPLADGASRDIAEFTPETLVENELALTILLDGKTLYYTSFSTEATDGGYTPYLGGYDLTAGAVKEFNEELPADSFILYGDYIYFRNSSDNVLYRMNKADQSLLKVALDGYYYSVIGDQLTYISIPADGSVDDISLVLCDPDGNIRKEIPMYDPAADLAENTEDVEFEDVEAVEEEGAEGEAVEEGDVIVVDDAAAAEGATEGVETAVDLTE